MQPAGYHSYGRDWTTEQRIAHMRNPGGINSGPVPPGAQGVNPAQRPTLKKKWSSRFFSGTPSIPPTPPPQYQSPPPTYIPTTVPVVPNVPNVPAVPAAYPTKHPLKLFDGGWRAAVMWSAIAITLVFIINIGLTIWAGRNYVSVDGLGTIYEGRCDVTKKYSTWMHLAINCFATVMLVASNYTMQCLSAPTRSEVDKEHARGRWLDIGISSLRNLSKLSRWKVSLWLLLGLSSMPLHLIYNSAIFSSLSTNAYVVDVIANSTIDAYLSNTTAHLGLSRDLGVFVKMDKITCMETYGKQFIPDRRDVLVIVDQVSEYHPPEQHGLYTAGTNTGRTPYDWICDSVNIDHTKSCDINDALMALDTWKMNGGNVLYCYSEEMDEKCSLQYSLHIMFVVILFNAVKMVCMYLAIYASKEDPLVTIGDAVASFLEREDQTTVGMCTATKSSIKKGHFNSLGLRAWRTRRASWYKVFWCRESWCKDFWFRSASFGRWALCYGLAIVSIGAAILSMIYGVTHNKHFGMIWKTGFGSVNIQTLAEVTNGGDRGYQGIIKSVIFANIPQTVFSAIYLLYNSIFTCMLLAYEWDRYSSDRRRLRVTFPRGEQRATYFLQIPYRYGVPLLLGSVAMHWLISQSVFLARVIEYRDGLVTEDSISTTGYSPMAIICAAVLGIFMLFILFLMGFRRYSGNMPLAASCSAAISAACHPSRDEPNASLGRLQWGVVSPGHCSFSSGHVTLPVEGDLYAGASSLGEEGLGVDVGAGEWEEP